MIVVSDTTPLSELAKVGKIDLLRDVFGEIIIPQEVYNEATRGNHPAASAVQSITWISVRTVSDPQKIFDLQAETNLHLGETAAIVLAEELGVDQILLDDRKARLVAESRNLPVIGTIGTLLLAKDEGLISSIKEILDNLRAKGKRISPKLYQEVLTEAQE